MDFNQLIKQRQSCRSYANTPVEREKVTAVIEAARLSPSACNSQPWHFVVVDDEVKRSQAAAALQSSGINKFTDNVSALIVVCEIPAKLMASATCDSQHYAQMDIGLSVAHMTLCATSLGLSSCIMGAFEEKPLKELLMIPKEATIRLVVGLGYAKEDKIRDKVRKSFDEACSFNQW